MAMSVGKTYASIVPCAVTEREDSSGLAGPPWKGVRAPLFQAPGTKKPADGKKPPPKRGGKRRLLRSTVHRLLFVCVDWKVGRLDDAHMRPHRLVPDPAEFMTWHQAFAGILERRTDSRHITRHDHRIDVRALDDEAVHDIGAGQ